MLLVLIKILLIVSCVATWNRLDKVSVSISEGSRYISQVIIQFNIARPEERGKKFESIRSKKLHRLKRTAHKVGH